MNCPQCQGSCYLDETKRQCCEECGWYDGYQHDHDFDEWLAQCPLTPEEAQRAYDETEPIPLSEERIKAIVDYAVGRTAHIPGSKNLEKPPIERDIR